MEVDVFAMCSRFDLQEMLLAKARDLHASGDMTLQEMHWNGASEAERKAIDHMGFWFASYKPSCWWYELFELL
eukprot:988772-Rhodomonas_salina.1